MIALITGSLAGCVTALQPRWIAWDTTAIPAVDSPVNLQHLNDHSAGSRGWVVPSPDGKLLLDDSRIRFWGANLSFGANFPEAEYGQRMMQRLSANGVNLVRFHHMDTLGAPDGIWTDDIWISGDRRIDPGQLDRWHALLAAAADEGIYWNLNLLVGRPFVYTDDLSVGLSGLSELDWKQRASIAMFHPELIELQQDYARQLLTTVNPYRRSTPIDDPAAAFIEIINENGLWFAHNNGTLAEADPELLQPLLTAWQEYLQERYGSLDEMHLRWQPTDESPQLVDSSPQNWNLEQHGSAQAAWNTEGTQIEISRAGIADWHVQLNRTITPPGIYLLNTMLRFENSMRPPLLQISAMQAADPWMTVDPGITLELDDNWQQVQMYLTIPDGEIPVRINFGGLGTHTGNLEIRNFALYRGIGTELLPAGDWSAIPLLTGADNRRYGPKAADDWENFLIEMERRYFAVMHDFIRDDLGYRGLIIPGTFWFTRDEVLQEYPVMTSHHYWQHPTFPNRDWDLDDWYVHSSTITDHPNAGLLQDAVIRFSSQARGVSEYNHPHPNPFQAEASWLLASLAGLHDWSWALPYSYAHSSDPDSHNGNSAFFDWQQNNLQLTAQIPAAIAYRTGMLDNLQELEFSTGPLSFGSVTARTDQALFTWGDLHRQQSIGPVSIHLSKSSIPGYAMISLVPIDGLPISESQDFLLTILGSFRLLEDQWLEYPNTPLEFPPPRDIRITLDRTRALPVQPEILNPELSVPEGWSIQALDSAGNPTPDPSLWYRIRH
ncbi:hypothetical protein JCM12856_05290 [Spirochaeta dissipatitropha]